MRTVYYTASSLDGFIADPEHSLAWLFAQEHQEPEHPEMRLDAVTERMGALLMGRSTYDFIRAETAAGAPWPYTAPTWVLTHREIPPVPDADIRTASGPVADVLPQVRASAAAGDLWVVGGGAVAADLASAGLLDEVVIGYAPVTLGAGAPLLPTRLQLRLLDVERAGTFVSARYTVEGPRPGADWSA